MVSQLLHHHQPSGPALDCLAFDISLRTHTTISDIVLVCSQSLIEPVTPSHAMFAAAAVDAEELAGSN